MFVRLQLTLIVLSFRKLYILSTSFTMHFKPTHVAVAALSVGQVQANHDISNALAGLASMTSQTSQLVHGISTENAVNSANVSPYKQPLA